MGEDVSHAAYGLDVVAAEVGIAQLLSDFADVHIDAAVKRRKLAAKHGIDEMLARDYSPSLAQQDMQQIEFDRSQFHRLAILPNDSRCRIKLDITDSHDVGDLPLACCALISGLGAAQDGANAGNQFARIERLGKIIVGANFKADNSVHIFTASREQQDRNAGRVSYPP